MKCSDFMMWESLQKNSGVCRLVAKAGLFCRDNRVYNTLYGDRQAMHYFRPFVV